ncbi:3'(2'),5'-bisphosphate nucleotidase CysQ [Pararhizobium antarcticum]|uniref:3'(2'),5'-bisphosphate nucleotidase CysQ n=1 Tax=Pararhizobium antarcticum TaxID=1798805 RepID=A0A657LXA9_9HYPH|nr:3'(2'),5'-bisphosphate nucleotidase CysQ [Pararhizobium antarcticum]OJF90427.1 3'(2'),5'-bisphosphate nucleotidase CysQ [Rhizobium sp. 58]OJG00624.1 3'(2'),5'-bisphosphate nucleotidase CysQ [Pararhizobium antarcticum]
MTAVHPSQDPWVEDLALITDAARAAGEKAMTYFRQDPDVQWKNGGRSPVSEADYAANDILKERLLAARPAYGWLSEETDDDEARLGCETLFVVDPIDGTRAFIAGKDVWCISVAVVHRGRPVAGVLFAPALDELFQASEGGFASKNGAAILVRAPPAGETLKIALAEDTIVRLEGGYRTGVSRISHVPSLAYRIAMIADGRIDGTVVKTNSHDWDLAAADLILEKAGGILASLDGQLLSYNRPNVRRTVLCAAAGPLLPALIAAAQGLEGH